MSFVTLVRHGQANTQARDELSYDKLSDLGWQQARWLGEYFDTSGERFSRVYTGTLRRHHETAEGINCPGERMEDARLNEMEYFTLATGLKKQHGIAMPQTREEFVQHMPILFQHWQDGKIDAAPEPFAAFEARTAEVISEIAAQDGPSLVVTSGGVIGMAMRSFMRLDLGALCHSALSIENTSVHRMQPLSTGLAVTQFNAIPHLDRPERRHARTHL